MGAGRDHLGDFVESRWIRMTVVLQKVGNRPGLTRLIALATGSRPKTLGSRLYGSLLERLGIRSRRNTDAWALPAKVCRRFDRQYSV